MITDKRLLSKQIAKIGTFIQDLRHISLASLAAVNDALKTLALQSYPKARVKIQAIVIPEDTELGATAYFFL